MIAYEEHQCTNHFLSFAEINCNKNCISHIILMRHNDRYYFKHINIICVTNVTNLHWYHLWNTIVTVINICNGKKMFCALMWKHYGIQCLSNPLLLEPCNDMSNVISNIMAHWYDLWNAIVIAIYFFNVKKMIYALMLIIHLWKTIVIAINFCNAKKMINALMFIMSNQYGRKCLSNELQLEQCNVKFTLISVIMAHWYEMWNCFRN